MALKIMKSDPELTHFIRVALSSTLLPARGEGEWWEGEAKEYFNKPFYEMSQS